MVQKSHHIFNYIRGVFLVLIRDQVKNKLQRIFFSFINLLNIL